METPGNKGLKGVIGMSSRLTLKGATGLGVYVLCI